MGVDDIEARPHAAARRAGGAAPRACRSPAGAESRARQLRGAGWELVELDVEAVDRAQGGDLVAHEAAALGVRRVGLHVGDHERAHDLVDRSALE